MKKEDLKHIIKEEIMSVLSEGDSEATELKLYADNDGALYERSYLPIAKNLVRKIARGVYDPEKAVKIWMYHADRAAQKYAKEFAQADEWYRIFDKPTRLAVAKEFANDFQQYWEEGSYREFVPKKYQGNF